MPVALVLLDSAAIGYVTNLWQNGAKPSVRVRDLLAVSTSCSTPSLLMLSGTVEQ